MEVQDLCLWYGETQALKNVSMKIPEKSITARQYMQGLTASKLYGHEELIGKEFSYEEVYPDIYEKLKQKEQEER